MLHNNNPAKNNKNNKNDEEINVCLIRKKEHKNKTKTKLQQQQKKYEGVCVFELSKKERREEKRERGRRNNCTFYFYSRIFFLFWEQNFPSSFVLFIGFIGVFLFSKAKDIQAF